MSEAGGVGMERPTAGRRLGWASWLIMAVPFALAVSTIYAVALDFSPAPIADQWEVLVAWRDAVEQGRFPLEYLLSQHNEHRILVPRLVYFADLKWFRGANVLNHLAIGAIQIAGAAFFVAAARPRTLRPIGVLGLAAALACLASLAQYQNFIWAFQVVFVAVYAAGVWAIYLFCLASADPARPRWRLLAGAMALLAVSAFSMANGFLAGFAMVLIGLVARRGWRTTLAAGLVTGALMAVYFYGYQSIFIPGTPPAEPLQAFVLYLLAYLGNLWAAPHLQPALAMGVLMVVATLGMGLYTLRARVDDPGRAALIGVVLFIGMTAGVTAIGRLNFGVEQALQSRYTTPSAYLWGAHFLFWALTVQGARRAVWKWAASLPLVLAFAGLLWPQKEGRLQIQRSVDGVLVASSAIVGGVDDPAIQKHIYWNPQKVREYTDFMREQKLAYFAHDPGLRAGQPFPAGRVTQEPRCAGGFDVVLPPDAAGSNWKAVGWAWDVEAKAPVDRVVLVAPDGRISGVAVSGMRREDVPKGIKMVTRPDAGWIGVVAPPDGQPLHAYGVLPEGRFCDLGEKAPA